MCVSRLVISDSLWSHELQPARLLCPWILQARILEFCHSFLQGILPTQESNPGLLHCRQILYHLSQQGSPHFFIAEDLLAKHISLHYWENWNNTGKKSSLPFFPFTLRWISLERLEEKFGDPSKGSDDPSRPVWSIELSVCKKKKKKSAEGRWVLHTWSLKTKECGCKKNILKVDMFWRASPPSYSPVA